MVIKEYTDILEIKVRQLEYQIEVLNLKLSGANEHLKGRDDWNKSLEIHSSGLMKIVTSLSETLGFLRTENEQLKNKLIELLSKAEDEKAVEKKETEIVLSLSVEETYVLKGLLGNISSNDIESVITTKKYIRYMSFDKIDGIFDKIYNRIPAIGHDFYTIGE